MLGRYLDYGSPVNWASPLNRGLVSWWMALPQRMGGLTFWDLCGRNHGVLTNGPTWQGARSRPGGWGSINTVAVSSQMVNCGNPAGLNGASAATLAAWACKVSTGESAGAGGSGGSASLGGNRFSFIWFSDGNVYFSAENSTSKYGYVALTGTGWHHFCIVFNGSLSGLSRITAYIDGAQSSLSYNSEEPTDATLGTVGPVTLGRDSSDRYTNGYYDDLRVWPTRALSAAEILSLYHASRTGYASELNYRRRTLIFDAGGGGGGASGAVLRGRVVSPGRIFGGSILC